MVFNLNGHWLMGKSVFDSAACSYTNFQVDADRFEAFLEGRTSVSHSLVVRDGVAHIPIVGALTSQPSFFFDLFGGGNTVYGDINQAIREANADPQVARIVLEINSPGGDVTGFADTARVIADSVKPVAAEVTDLAASAAFGLAAQADSISVNNSMALVGSIGVVTSRFADDGRITIRSTEAPNKNPDISTEDGRDAVRETLDALHDEFVAVISAGRTRSHDDPVTPAQINQNYGRGSVVIATEALQRGMIDAIASRNTDAPQDTENSAMNLEELKAKYPALFAAVHEGGIVAGEARERERVSAHIISARGCGNLDLGLQHIESGAEYGSPTVQASYNVAGMNSAEQASRTDDNVDTGTATAGAGDENGMSKAAAEAQTNAIFDGLSDTWTE